MKNIFKCIGWSILYFVITFIVQFGFMMVGISNGIENEEMLNQFAINNNLLLTIFSNIVAIIIFGIIWNVKKHKKQEKIKNTKKDYLLLILIAFLYSLLFLIITQSVSFSGINDTIISMNYFNSKNQFLGFALYTISILVIAPIAEELLCRGIMIGELNKKFSENKSIIISAIVFGVMHLMAGGLVLSIGAIIMGVILGFVYKTTKSLSSTMLVHSVANFADIVMLLVGKISSTNILVFSIIISIALISVLVFYCKNRKSVIIAKEPNEV